MAESMGYSYGLEVGDTIYVSGQVARNGKGEIVGPGDIRLQTEEAFRNVAAVLAEGGATLDDVVQLNIFIKDRSFAPVVQEVRKATFHAPYPTACLVVAEAVRTDYLIEVQAVAVKRG